MQKEIIWIFGAPPSSLTSLDRTCVLHPILAPLPLTFADLPNDEHYNRHGRTQQSEDHQERETINQILQNRKKNIYIIIYNI